MLGTQSSLLTVHAYQPTEPRKPQPMTTAKPVAIATSYDHAHRAWVAVVFTHGVEQTRARGRNEACAVADAVGAFRTTRTVRKAA